MLGSGKGSNLAAIADACAAGKIPVEVAIVLSDLPEAGILTQARERGLTADYIAPGKFRTKLDDEAERAYISRLIAAEVDLIALAGFMRILKGEFLRAFAGRVINIHPSLLPHFPGAAPYKQAYESGVRVHGCTAHFVTDQLDEGPVIMQDVFHINVGSDTLEDVKEKGLELEAQVLSKSVQLFLDEELVVVEGKVIFKPGISRFLKVSE